MAVAPLHGSVFALTLYDVCDEIDLSQLPALISAKRQAPPFKHTTPEYVRFESPPVTESLGPVTLDTGEQFEGTMQYYDYGVVSVLLQRSFCGDWADLQHLAARWISGALFDEFTTRLVRQRLDNLRSGLGNPYASLLSEDYYILHLVASEDGSATDLILKHGQDVSQIITGEITLLAPAEKDEVLQARMSYYTNDLTVLRCTPPFAYDT